MVYSDAAKKGLIMNTISIGATEIRTDKVKVSPNSNKIVCCFCSSLLFHLGRGSQSF